jgi:hypothetical protein
MYRDRHLDPVRACDLGGPFWVSEGGSRWSFFRGGRSDGGERLDDGAAADVVVGTVLASWLARPPSL